MVDPGRDPEEGLSYPIGCRAGGSLDVDSLSFFSLSFVSSPLTGDCFCDLPFSISDGVNVGKSVKYVGM